MDISVVKQKIMPCCYTFIQPKTGWAIGIPVHNPALEISSLKYKTEIKMLLTGRILFTLPYGIQEHTACG